MSSHRISLLLCCVVLVAGCASMRPLPLAEPKAGDQPDKNKGGLEPASDLPGAVANLKIYADKYMDHATVLHGSDYTASDVTFGGGVLGLAGGLTKSPETAILGALLSGGGSTAAQRYQYKVQAKNYEAASDAMYCMYRVLRPLQAEGLVPAELVNEKIDEVRRKLRVNQAAVSLVSPDLQALEKAIKDLIPAEKAVNDAIAAAGERTNLSDQAMREAKADELKAEVVKCVAAF